MGFFENIFMKGSDGIKQNVDIGRLSNLGAISFGPGITDKNSVRTPHYEIKKTFDMFENNVIVSSAINQLVSFVIPNKRLKVISKDKNSIEYLQSFCDLRKDLLEEAKNFLTTRLLCGNSFAETLFTGREFDNFFSFNASDRIYVNPDDETGEHAFILQVPIGLKVFSYRGNPKTPAFLPVRYVKNYQYTMERVYGVWLSKDEIYHWKSGWSRDNIYGRSQLASAINADDILSEIISTWDTVIRTRRTDIKIYSVADAETGKRYTQKQLDDLGQKLTDSNSSFKLINVPLKLNESEIKTTGTYDLFEGIVDSVRRMIMMALLPQHLTPWNDSATTQGSDSAMPPFLLRIKTLQQELTNVLNACIIDNLRKTESWLSDDLSFVFDEPAIMGQDYYLRTITEMLSADIITKEEAKQYLLKMGILDSDILESKNTGIIDGNRATKGTKRTERKLITYEQYKQNQKVIKEVL